MQKPKSANRPLRVGLISLGCAKNLVDAEIMLGSLLKDGLNITNDPAQADVLIVNTCSFIDAAQEESVDAILQSAELRNARQPNQALVVSGCLPQRFRDDLPNLLPEVDAFMGIDEVTRVNDIIHHALDRRREKLAAPSAKSRATKSTLVRRFAQLDKSRSPSDHEAANKLRGTSKFGKTGQILAPPAPIDSTVTVQARPTYIPDYATPRFRLTPKHFAYVKIAEGCNHPCSFCIIPRMRGSHRSRLQDDVVREARQLLEQGVKEINLISQDSTYYGLDLRPKHSRAIASPEKFTAASRALPADATTLSSLLRALNQIPGQFWIRLLYTHPAHWTDELIRTIADCPKVARYVDMPLQHIHDAMLERMRRETSRRHIIDLIAKIRAGIPGIALRTTFIVGFPGETDEYFQSLLEFIRATRFERLGVFTYSRQEDTRAGNMQGHIPDRTKVSRRKQAMAAQLEVARQVSASFLGRQLTALVEGPASSPQLRQARVLSWEHGLLRKQSSGDAPSSPGYLVARGEADAPDIDGRIYLRGALKPGQFANVKVVGHTDYDLIAEPLTR